MPLVMARFHLCTPVAIVLNTVLWLPMACGLVSGAILLVLGGLVPPLGHLCGWFCNLNFGLLEWCVTAARSVPGGHFWLPGPADWWLWGFYGGLGLLAAFPRLRPPRRWCVGLLAAWIAVGFAASTWRHDRNRLDCTLLSVGHGCAVLLELPSGQTLLYDAGQLGEPADRQPGDLRVPLVAGTHGTSTPSCSPTPIWTTSTPCRACWTGSPWAWFTSRR